jgi:hypothetical protein
MSNDPWASPGRLWHSDISEYSLGRSGPCNFRLGAVAPQIRTDMPRTSKTPSIVLAAENSAARKKGKKRAQRPGALSTPVGTYSFFPKHSLELARRTCSSQNVKLAKGGHRPFQYDQRRDIVPHFFTITKTLDPLPFPPSIVGHWAFTPVGSRQTACVPSYSPKQTPCSPAGG